MGEPIKLYSGDQRCARLLEALEVTILEKATGMPIPSIIGCLELMKDIVRKMPHHE